MAERHVSMAADVDEEILDLAQNIYESFYEGKEVDWPDFLDRMDRVTLANGDILDLDASMVSPAIVKIKTHVRQLAKQV